MKEAESMTHEERSKKPRVMGGEPLELSCDVWVISKMSGPRSRRFQNGPPSMRRKERTSVSRRNLGPACLSWVLCAFLLSLGHSGYPTALACFLLQRHASASWFVACTGYDALTCFT